MDTTQQKPRSIRVDDQTFERFRELSASFENQGSALTALVSAWEIQQARTVLTDRETEVVDFSSLLQKIQDAYLHSLEITENTQSRVRDEFRSQLDSKDQVIANLQKQLDQAEAVTRGAQEQSSTAKEQVKALQAKLDTEAEARQSAEEAVKDKSAIIASLNRQLAQMEGAENRIAEAQTKVQEAEKRAQEAAERARNLETQLANIQAQVELEAEKSALKLQSAVLEARQEQQDRIAELMNENHALIREVADLKANASKPAPKARSTKTTASNTPETQ